MGKINMLAAANIRKSKSQTVSLLVFILIATMFLNIGLVLFFNFTAYFDERAEELNAPHATFLQEESITTDEQLDWLVDYRGVTQIEEQSVVSGWSEYYMNDSKTFGVLIFANASKKQGMDTLSLIGESQPLNENSIYVPYLMKTAGGYELGDTYKIELLGTELEFTIAGFTEEITFGSLTNTFYRFYVSDSRYSILEEEFSTNKCYLRTVRMEDYSLGYQLENDYLQEFFYQEDAGDTSSDFIEYLDYENSVKQSRTFILLIMAMTIFVFAVILVMVSLIVIRFGIINNIDESMTNIGILKAAGYKNNQISYSIIIQFCSVAFVGSILGALASQLTLPMILGILESQSALVWVPDIDYIKAMISLVSVLALVLIVSLIAARRIYKLHPLTALRGGHMTHSFKKNYMPLDKSRGNLSMLLAGKQFLQNKKQGVMIIIIVAFLSFASIFGISIYYNIGVESEAFIHTLVGEVPDATVSLKDSNDVDSLVARLRESEVVRKVFGYQSIAMLADDYDVTSIIIEDFSMLEGEILYDGRYPTHSNEVAVSGNVAKITGKDIGDTISIKQGGEEKEFVISGLIQIVNNGGFAVTMSNDALLTMQDSFQYSELYIYLADGKDAKEFIKEIKNSEGDIFTSTTATSDQIDAQFKPYGIIFAAVVAVILIITVIVVVLVLYLVIKTIILRRKHELGIQKAVGFTSVQLMNQTALNYTPLICAGVLIGGISGYFALNPVFTALMGSMGIMNTRMPSPTSWVIITCITLILLAYVVSMLVAWRIRKISPYSLIS